MSEALLSGADIIPAMRELCAYIPYRRVGDTETGDAIRAEIESLERLVAAFEQHSIREVETGGPGGPR